MFAFVIRRLLQAVLVLVVVAFISFLLFQYVGDPLRRESLDDGIAITTLKQLPAGKDAPVVGMTFLSAVFQLVLGVGRLATNVLLLDEAGQLPLAQGALAGLLGAGSLLLFGDDMQMPPVFEGELADEPLAVSVFGQLRRSRPETVMALRTSYRMNQLEIVPVKWIDQVLELALDSVPKPLPDDELPKVDAKPEAGGAALGGAEALPH